MRKDFFLGATSSGSKASFSVWAPKAFKVDVLLPDRSIPLERTENGYFFVETESSRASLLYKYRLDNSQEFPDPASRFQPDGVFGPSALAPKSEVEEPDSWLGLALTDYIIYELHVGSFTPEGTLYSATQGLDRLCELGITAVELMPIAQFSGRRNWGYDGVFPFAVQNSYGGPEALRHFIAKCHQRGLAVVLDVVYNHLGPEGNCLDQYGYYFSKSHSNAWGTAINFDGPYSNEVRRYFIENALMWLRDFKIDALRLDAIHAIVDFSAKPFLQELSEAVDKLEDETSRKIYLMAENDNNDSKCIRPRVLGGWGIDAQWNDDFHHSIYSFISGERRAYYADFGSMEAVYKCLKNGYVREWEYSSFRKRKHGSPSFDISPNKFIVFSQNHDQIGNRAKGDRTSLNLSFEQLKLFAAMVMLTPFTPLLFMGEEYGEKKPFNYFVDHCNSELIKAIRDGRKREFCFDEGSFIDPFDEKTFVASIIDPSVSSQQPHLTLYNFYRALISLRKETMAMRTATRENIGFSLISPGTILYRNDQENGKFMVFFNFSDKKTTSKICAPSGTWVKAIDSSDPQWLGPGSETPERLASDGSVCLYLAGCSALCMALDEDEGDWSRG